MAETGNQRITKQTIRRQRGALSSLVGERMQQLGHRNVGEFAKYAGISESGIYSILNGRIEDGTPIVPKWQTMVALARALERPTHELLYILDPSAPGADLQLGVAQMPVYLAGCVGAGPDQLRELEENVFVDAEFAEGRDLVAFRVKGNSMAGGRRPIYDGDIVIVDRKIGAEVNSPVVARLRDDGYVVKRLRQNGFLDSANPDYDDPDMAMIDPSRIADLIGRVVRVHSELI